MLDFHPGVLLSWQVTPGITTIAGTSHVAAQFVLSLETPAKVLLVEVEFAMRWEGITGGT